MKRPLIGITGKRRFGRDLAGNWSSMSDSSADVFWVMYAEGIFVGGFPVFLPIDVDPVDAVDNLDGLLPPAALILILSTMGKNPSIMEKHPPLICFLMNRCVMNLNLVYLTLLAKLYLFLVSAVVTK